MAAPETDDRRALLQLLCFLNRPDLTPGLIDQAFEIEGRDIGEGLGTTILEHRTEAGPFTGLESVSAVPGIGPTRQSLMLQVATQGGLEGLTEPEPLRLTRLPSVLRDVGIALIGDACSPTATRLDRAGRRLLRAATFDPSLEAGGKGFVAAAEAARDGRPATLQPGLLHLLKAPAPARAVELLEPTERGGLSLLDERLAAARRHLGMWAASTWLAEAGPQRGADAARALGAPAPVASAFGYLAPNACRIGDAQLTQAGVALVGAAAALEQHLPVLVFVLGFCQDDCTPGAKRNCQANELYIVPGRRDATDKQDFGEALAFLRGFSLIPGKTVSPGGKAMMRQIAKNLAAPKTAQDKKMVKLYGYDVYMRLTYQQCVKGFCGAYWTEASKIVQVDPPKGKEGGDTAGQKEGWRPSIIEALGKNKARTAGQLAEFARLAEKQCP